MINHANIFYVRNIHAIGGVETFVYELAKKYKDYDIAVVCKDIAYEQRKRLRKYCRIYVHKDQQINCKVIITNWDTSILDYVNEDAKKYVVLHTDYKNPTERRGLPKDRPDITYIGITEASKKNFEEITGIHRTILCRNPLEIEKDEPILTLVSATRLTKIKDDGRHLQLADALDRQHINYIWYIFTTDEYSENPIWKHKNIVHCNNRLDLGTFYKNADWYVQLSSCEGDSYSLKEALYRGTPIVVCELPYFKEIGIKDGENALFYNIDNSNADDVATRMQIPLKFEFKHVQDGYNEILDKTQSRFKEEMNMKVKVRATKNFNDLVEKVSREKGKSEWICSRERADFLFENNAVEFLEEIEEQPTIEEEKPVEKPKKKAAKKNNTKK